ncbi:LuxR family transcriptional regulator [Mycolicibacterium sp. CBMA 226]|uniref:helix-turn-helix transcriptional regulator n=1 Tax=Mycolicibacterium sp. CBMA 226 TaxID=2606611 RepID=UPI00130BA119|nr:LuxR family transcriptional regulator [Mycolicibacterium sp. CBMA 226]MUL75625.1 helix-turn-helix domain-containing protein [Mycolicibacterium sp. CBMA 226]
MPECWPLTGRRNELRAVREMLAADARGGLVLAGAAGVGKTRLAGAAAELATQSGWVVRRVAGTATGRQVTLGAFARWTDDSDTSPLRLARKVLAELIAGADGAPLLLIVDDAHLLDDLSALVVHQLALQDVAGMLVTIRRGERAPDAVTALWKDGLLRRLELLPLPRQESDRVLAAALGGPVGRDCADRMWRLSRGNALFLRHLVDHERESGRLTTVDGEWRWNGKPSASPSLVELVEQQIGAISENVREVVDIVAIAEPINRGLLQELVGTQAVEAAEQCELITMAAAGDAVCVGHPLYSEIRLSRCGPLRLRRLRGRVASAMAEGKVDDPLQLGLLWLASDLPSEPNVLRRAAKAAAARLDLRLAERLCREAIGAEPSRAAKLLLSHILFLQEKGESAREILDSLDADDTVEPGFLDGVLQRAAVLMWPLRNPDEAVKLIDSSMSSDDHSRNHALRTFRAIAHVMAAEPAAAIRTMSVVDHHRLDAIGKVVARTVETIAHGDLGRTREATQSAAAGYRSQLESPHDAIHGTGLAEFHAEALLAAGYVEEAAGVAEREYERCRGFDGASLWMALAAQGMTALGGGDLAAALAYLRSASAGFGDSGDTGGVFYRTRIPHIEALARSGDVTGAIAAATAAARLRHPTWTFLEPSYLRATAWVRAVQGQLAEAREIAVQAAQFAQEHGQPAREVMCLQTATSFGATGCDERLTELAAQVQGPRAPLAARYARALTGSDAAGLDAVSRAFESMGDVLAAADAAAQASVTHRRDGEAASALAASGRAQLLALRCGGAISPALTAAKVELPFTRREHEITRLVSQGLSNKEIAVALSLSVRTVEGHVYQAGTKAGISTRAELSALVRQFEEVKAGSS